MMDAPKPSRKDEKATEADIGPSRLVLYHTEPPSSGGWQINMGAALVTPLLAYIRDTWTNIGLHFSRKHTPFPPYVDYKFTLGPYNAQE